jgi:hypothetical protein
MALTMLSASPAGFPNEMALDVDSDVLFKKSETEVLLVVVDMRQTSLEGIRTSVERVAMKQEVEREASKDNMTIKFVFQNME